MKISDIIANANELLNTKFTRAFKASGTIQAYYKGEKNGVYYFECNGKIYFKYGEKAGRLA